MMVAPTPDTQIRLKQLLSGIVDIPAEADCTIHGLSQDSRQVQHGYLFLACKGLTVHGADFIDTAIEQGAIAVLWDVTGLEAESFGLHWRKSSSGESVPVIAVDELTDKVGYIADRFYAQPSRQLRVIGITGTNGKTSCSHFLAQALSDEKPCGVIGTLGQGLYGQLQETGHTTSDAVSLHKWMANMLADGVKNVSMEVSSHALHQGRTNGVVFDTAIFTNLSRDHLDYHIDMQEYADTKRKLFMVKGLQHAVINSDDEFGRALLDSELCARTVLSYGLDARYEHDIYAYDIELDARGINCKVKTPAGEGLLNSSLLGRFNISNLLAVLGALLLHKMDLPRALSLLAGTETVNGRMQRFGGDEQPLVVVDYAHTPDALLQALTALREHCAGKLFCVFGCGGDRDKGKRPQMGNIAEHNADVVIVTDDNPRHENAADIIEDILQGLTKPQAIEIIADRKKAIQSALKQASKNDIVLVAGKGHENYQQVGDVKQPFSDIEEVQAGLRELSL